MQKQRIKHAQNAKTLQESSPPAEPEPRESLEEPKVESPWVWKPMESDVKPVEA